MINIYWQTKFFIDQNWICHWPVFLFLLTKITIFYCCFHKIYWPFFNNLLLFLQTDQLIYLLTISIFFFTDTSIILLTAKYIPFFQTCNERMITDETRLWWMLSSWMVKMPRRRTRIANMWVCFFLNRYWSTHSNVYSHKIQYNNLQALIIWNMCIYKNKEEREGVESWR